MQPAKENNGFSELPLGSLQCFMLVNNALSGGSQLEIRRTSTDLNFIYQYLELLAFSMLFVGSLVEDKTPLVLVKDVMRLLWCRREGVKRV